MLTCYYTSLPHPKAERRWLGGDLEAGALARKIVELLAEKQAEDVLPLDISKVVSFADYFVIASAQTVRQLEAMLESVDEGLSGEDAKPMGREREAASGGAP